MISIIIPVLNEEDSILSLLDHLNSNASFVRDCEIIVVDGGSTDHTREIISSYTTDKPAISLTLVNSPKGRAKQLHEGALNANGNIFYFLHADSYPPKNFDNHIRKAIKSGNPAGCFRMKFDSSHLWLKMIGWWTRFNWKASRGGDQSQYITRDLYKEIGGYDTNLPIYEDYDIINKLYEFKKYHVIPKWLKTSDRRYREVGVMRLQWYYLQIYYKKYRGATIEEILAFYRGNCN
ncbi:glycosyl transferase family 2 [Nonlabens spongiae]|uniref:Glycosyl transferase family 2 n=1 Tax=Nonlabens spongiae TaxID=331648 RepID=A0A1W6MPQ9_9FLAO|nr:glycosyl transferase family 2 [Nonlabens spongiae]